MRVVVRIGNSIQFYKKKDSGVSAGTVGVAETTAQMDQLVAGDRAVLSPPSCSVCHTGVDNDLYAKTRLRVLVVCLTDSLGGRLT
jgi:hypothetical protein